MREKLKQIRKEKGYTVKEIAENLRISEVYYYKIEAKTRNPSMKLAKKIENLFNVKMEELFSDIFEEIEKKRENSL